MRPQIIKFFVVGTLATAIHITIVVALVKLAGMDPVLSSIPAFLLAFSVSYLMNHTWTFSATGRHFIYLPKYFAVSITGLLLNLGIMYTTVSVLQLPYPIGLGLVVLCVPLLSFALNKFWTFLHIESVGLLKRKA